jgi:hypothetical protein
MQLTDQELFRVLTERFYTYQDSAYAKGSDEHNKFVDTLKEFVTQFFNDKASIQFKDKITIVATPENTRKVIEAALVSAVKNNDYDGVQTYSQALQRI